MSEKHTVSGTKECNCGREHILIGYAEGDTYDCPCGKTWGIADFTDGEPYFNWSRYTRRE